MNLNFSGLTQAAEVKPTLKHRGQVGPVGTSTAMRVSSSWAGGGKVGTSGGSTPSPQASPACPQDRTAGKPIVYAASPASPHVPGDFEQEAFEERAAIMEFDGGMSRIEAEAAAREIIGAVLAKAKLKDAI